jgi:hypothetical protein
MEHTLEEIRLLYRSSPAKVYKKLKAGDRLYADNPSLLQSIRILSVCRIAHQLIPFRIQAVMYMKL